MSKRAKPEPEPFDPFKPNPEPDPNYRFRRLPSSSHFPNSRRHSVFGSADSWNYIIAEKFGYNHEGGEWLDSTQIAYRAAAIGNAKRLTCYLHFHPAYIQWGSHIAGTPVTIRQDIPQGGRYA